jgi:hypothetical protein
MQPRRKLSVALGLAGTLLSRVAAAETDWLRVRTEADGLTVESRAVAGSEMPELRVTIETVASPLQLLASAWELRDDGMQAAYLERRTVLSESDGERTLFLALRPPIISPRHCVLRQKRWSDASGVQHLRFDAMPYTPVSDGAVPFAHLRGEWRFEPSGATGARVVYTTLVDLGGVPALIARGPQLDATVQTVREVVARARAR